MGHTLTIRLAPDQAEWLERVAKESGMSKGQIVRDHLAKARVGAKGRPFMRWAGSMHGPKDLSTRKGFSTK
jgi:hypothetical protein